MKNQKALCVVFRVEMWDCPVAAEQMPPRLYLLQDLFWCAFAWFFKITLSVFTPNLKVFKLYCFPKVIPSLWDCEEVARMRERVSFGSSPHAAWRIPPTHKDWSSTKSQLTEVLSPHVALIPTVEGSRVKAARPTPPNWALARWLPTLRGMRENLHKLLWRSSALPLLYLSSVFHSLSLSPAAWCFIIKGFYCTVISPVVNQCNLSAGHRHGDAYGGIQSNNTQTVLTPVFLHCKTWWKETGINLSTAVPLIQALPQESIKGFGTKSHYCNNTVRRRWKKTEYSKAALLI